MELKAGDHRLVTLSWSSGASFSFHVKKCLGFDGEIVIDQCDGMTIEDGLSLFPRWIIEEALKAEET